MIKLPPQISKRISITAMSLLIIIMVTATIAEKTYGTPFVNRHFYSNPLFIALWFLAAISGITHILKRKLYRRIITFCMHASFVIILTGAFITHVFGVQGSIHLRMDENPQQCFRTADNAEHKLPFSVSLKGLRTEYYSGTTTPMDYVSTITIQDGTDIEGAVSMNRILRNKGYRFYQSGYDADGKGSTLYVSHDPIGIAVTYSGYILLFLSMALFFFEKKSAFMRKISAACVLLLIPFVSSFAGSKLPPVLSSPLLSIHVMSIMISYSLFAIMMLNGISAEILHRSGNRSSDISCLENSSRIILYPAVFLLVFGIFIGAIWANVSWGRYWLSYLC